MIPTTESTTIETAATGSFRYGLLGLISTTLTARQTHRYYALERT